MMESRGYKIAFMFYVWAFGSVWFNKPDVMSEVYRLLLTMLSCFGQILSFPLQEIRVFYAFTYRDILPGFVPPFLYGGIALKRLNDYHPLPGIVLTERVLYLILWLVCFNYFLTLSNQIASNPEEDRLNKPDRPLVTGLVTLHGAKVRWLITTTVFLALAISKPDLLPATLTWMATVAFLLFTPQGGHWLGKNTIAMALGAWANTEGACRAVSVQLSPQVDRWRLAGIVWAALMVQIQDLRDRKGDRKVGRKTLPVVFGNMGSRWLIVLVFEPLAFLALCVGGLFPMAPYVTVISHLLIGYRVIQGGSSKTPQYDGYTFQLLSLVGAIGVIIVGRESWNVAGWEPSSA